MSLVKALAEHYDLEPTQFTNTIKNTVMPQGATNDHLCAFLMVARKYDLNPLTKEIYAFPSKGGGIQPIVSIDGWLKIINSHPQFDGTEFEDHLNDGKLYAVTCRIYRKDRSKPTEVTEYMEECRRNSEPWQKWPARMLRHKAMIQCARYAFGFSGIVDPDEGERIKEVDVTDRTERVEEPASKQESIKDKLRQAQTIDQEPVHAEDLPEPEIDPAPKKKPRGKRLKYAEIADQINGAEDVVHVEVIRKTIPNHIEPDDQLQELFSMCDERVRFLNEVQEDVSF